MTGLFDFGTNDKPSPFSFAPRKKKDRAFLYNLYDNIVGVDDGVNTPGERLGKGVNDLAKGLATDPLGMAGRAAQAVKGDLDNLMFEGGATQRPEDVLGYAAAPMVPGAMSGRAANVLSSGGPKPSQDVLDLLKSGRGSEVTDEMMATADPQYLYNNYDLPMDEASRMARAGEMGFDTGTDLYHGTTSKTDYSNLIPSQRGKIGPGVYLTPEANRANVFAGADQTSIMLREDALPNSRVMPLVATNNPADDATRSLIWKASRDEAGRYLDDAVTPTSRIFADAGADGVRVADERTIINPANIRSKFARFDPRLKHLSNLSAAGAGAAYLGAQGSEQNQMAQIRAYLEGKQ